MNRFLLLAVAATTAFSTFASAPSFVWGKLIDSPQTQDLSAKVVMTTDGSAVSLSQFGSRTASDNISYDDEVIATGAATVSNSDNLNLLVIKHNIADGSRLWSVSSKMGDFAISSASNMVATADGGVLVLVNARSSNQESYSSPVLVDNSGAEVEFSDWNTSVWIYNQVLIKINASGNIEWARNIVMDQLPVPAASSGTSVNATTNGVTPYALAEDADGNIYIGGNYRAPMILNGEKYSTYVLTPRNVASYNGDSQQSAGGMYVIRLDSEGNYVNHLKASGELTRDQACLFSVDGNDLYIAGNIQGQQGNTLTIGSESISIENTYDSFFVAKVATDLKTVSYLKYIKGYGNSASKSSTKLRDLQVINGKLYVVGGGTGGYGAAGSSEAAVKSTGTTEEGWLIALNPEDASWLGAANNATNIGAYLNVFTYNDKLYVYGYRLNKADGTFIDEYSFDNYEREARYTVAKGGGAPTGYSACFNPSSKVVATLTRGNAAFTFGDESTSAAPTSWGGLIAVYSFDQGSSSVDAVANTKSFKAVGADGQIEITASDDSDVVITNAAGQTLSSQSVKAGKTTFTCQAGLYFVNDIKVIVK